MDVGSPKRELLWLFYQVMCGNSSIIQPSPSGILPVHNVIALGQNVYEICRKITTIAILHGHKAFHALPLKWYTALLEAS